MWVDSCLRLRLRSGVLLVAPAVILCASLFAACGKKGPPLAPLLRVPAAVDRLSVRRLDRAVYVEFAVPARNQDGSTPADVARVEVYAVTARTPDADTVLEYGTRVGSVSVRRPPPPEADERRASTVEAKAKSADSAGTVDQGEAVTFVEALTPENLQPAKVPPPKPPAPGSKVPALGDAARAEQPLARFYVAVVVNHRGRRAAPSRPAGVPVAEPPTPPANLQISNTESNIVLAWGAVPPAGSSERQPPVAYSYNAYSVPAVSGPTAASEPASKPASRSAAPAPLNDKPLTTNRFEDSAMEFGVERCYAVRTVASVGGMQMESAEARGCITPKDTFPPAAPKGLTAVTSTGGISLIWEPNTEADLGGYLVLRGELPGVKLQPITPEPIHETTFNDTTVKAGVRYVYAIVALDKASPPNLSAQSNRVEETAR